MTRRFSVVGALLTLLVAPLAAEHHEGGEVGSVYGATLAANFEFVSGQLMQLADAIPEDVYGWSPTEEVRTTSAVFMHIVSANLLLPPAFGVAPAEGLEIPENPFDLAREWEANVTAKADVIAKLKKSIAYAQNAQQRGVALVDTTEPFARASGAADRLRAQQRRGATLEPADARGVNRGSVALI